MPIRLSGMASGLDTEALVRDLMKAYNGKKDKMTKAQTKLEWKQDSWKDMNSKIYKFYSSNLSNMRFSGDYALKSASIGDSSIAKVSANSKSVAGTQTLLVKQLASSGYLTGGEIKAADADTKLTGSSKLSEIEGFNAGGTGTITVGVGGKNTDISINSDTTVNEFVNKLKEAGVNANFDEKYGRFFISAKGSGKDNDFSITASNSDGLNALKSMKLYTNNSTESAEYSKWANYSDSEIAALKDKEYEANKYTSESLLKTYSNELKSAKSSIDSLNKTNEDLAKQREKLVAEKDNEILTQDDKDAIDKKIAELDEKVAKNNETIAEKQSIVDDKSQYVAADDDSDDVKAAKAAKLDEKVAELNADVRAKADAKIDEKVAFAKEFVNSSNSSSDGAVRTVGQDSIIELNGAEFKSATNDYEINGLNISVTQESKDGKATTITTSNDVDGIYNKIKDFLKSYNELIKEMDTAYNAPSAGKYEPLTDEEKEDLSDSEVEKWEKKVKDALLRRDNTLGGISSMMKTSMLKSFNINGKSMSLSDLGIKTSGYFASGDNEKGVFHIDGDKDDTATSGSVDKLKAALSSDPDSVIEFFSKLSDEVYQGLTKKMAGSTMSSAYTVYNDKKMQSDFKEQKNKISDFEKKLEAMEEKYYKQFSAMEKALSKLQSSTSQMQGMF